MLNYVGTAQYRVKYVIMLQNSTAFASFLLVMSGVVIDKSRSTGFFEYVIMASLMFRRTFDIFCSTNLFG